MNSIYDCERADLAHSLSPSYRSTQIFKSIYQRWLEDFEQMTDLPKAERTRFAAEFEIHLPEIHRRFDSADGTRRYLIRLDD